MSLVGFQVPYLFYLRTEYCACESRGPAGWKRKDQKIVSGHGVPLRRGGRKVHGLEYWYFEKVYDGTKRHARVQVPRSQVSMGSMSVILQADFSRPRCLLSHHQKVPLPYSPRINSRYPYCCHGLWYGLVVDAHSFLFFGKLLVRELCYASCAGPRRRLYLIACDGLMANGGICEPQ